MCTVSFVVAGKKVVITSNRDEHRARPAALIPKMESVDGKNLFFPKDPRGQGTWFCVDELGRCLVLLNGAAKGHISTPPYAKSRGLVVLDLMKKNDVLESWKVQILENIEPFTLVYFSTKRLFQLRWDGLEKSCIELDVRQQHIWSSSTLYGRPIRQARAAWFRAFLKNQKIGLDEANMIDFHSNTQKNDPENGLIINRDSQILTKNITQYVLENAQIALHHYDLIAHQKNILKWILPD